MLVWMTRPLLLVPALAIIALLAAVPVAPAATAPVISSANIEAEFDLPANNGLRASVAFLPFASRHTSFAFTSTQCGKR